MDSPVACSRSCCRERWLNNLRCWECFWTVRWYMYCG